MLPWIARRVEGTLGPYIVGGLAALLFTLSVMLMVQTIRIDRLKAAPVKAELKTAHKVIERTAKADAVTAKVGEKTEAAQVQIRTVTRTIVEKVPVYVSPETDARYPLPWGFVRLHDAAALGLDPSALPNPSGEPDDAPSSIEPSDAATVIAGNYGQCREWREQVIGWQDWYRQTAALWNAR